MSYKLIALDLDGTLLNSSKEITDYTYKILEKAHEKGSYIVPTSGRFYHAMPECVKSLPFVNYAITLNGGLVLDCRKNLVLSSHFMCMETALDIIDFLESKKAAYDVFTETEGYMNEWAYENIQDYVSNPFYIANIKQYRKPVKAVKSHIKASDADIYKIQFYSKEPEIIQTYSSEIKHNFSGICVATSGYNDSEITDIKASKGIGLTELADYLNIDISETIAFGDSANDIELIRTAGYSVVMGNSKSAIIDMADYITCSNDEDGVAKAIEKFVL